MAQTKSIGKTNVFPIFETGIVSAIDERNCRVRVQLPSRGNIETYWLEVLSPGTKLHRFYWMPGLGDQVRILVDSNLESGCVLGCIYSKPDPPPVQDADKFVMHFGDGGYVEYNANSGVLRINCAKVQIVTTEESTLQGKAIAVVGASDNDNENSGPDQLVNSGQF